MSYGINSLLLFCVPEVYFLLSVKSVFLKIGNQGDIYDHESLVKAIKTVDVVISAIGYSQVADQTKIIAAVKEAGNVKVRPFSLS